ncbi:hypothetical protein [Leifsonia sp. C5G2]|uniref:hypothetical protein n=1 Tax=Leifsonia sp. C5G2 TaxID=2735269 RepID=UPI001584C6BD|nr:hypothetical protein [Leifsonia sp. C5G2]NUU05099.1 hypothetical protein [Leifsonia sp. C5G2]
MTMAIILAVGIGAVGNGCSLIGGTTVSQEEAREINLENQRRVALKFINDYSNPELTALRFTNEGGRPGFGASWRVNAVATVNGADFEEILATDFWGGDPLPDTPAGAAAASVCVTYSDGTSEILK